MDPWLFNLKPVVTPEDPDVTPAYLLECYQKVLNSKVQIRLTDGDEITTIDAVDQHGQPVTVRDVLQLNQ
jgi:hypothetical protein